MKTFFRSWLMVFVSILLCVGTASGTFTATAQFDVRSTATAADVNGGLFDTGVAGFPTDGAATVANTSAPIFTSASYNFVAGDVGAKVYIGAGTNWLQGWYTIASVAANAATLTAGVGTATLAVNGQPTILNTVAGVATVASPSGATWGLDYSQQNAAQIAFTDMVIGGTTTQFTSAAHPVGKNFIGNSINVISGTGFTVQRAVVISTVTTTATCDRSLGTGGSTGGTGNLGGSLLTVQAAVTLMQPSNEVWIKSGTYSSTTQLLYPAINGDATTTGESATIGYNALHADGGTKPLLTTATNSIKLINFSGGSGFVFRNLSLSSTAGTRGDGFHASTNNVPNVLIQNCLLDGFNVGINGDFNVDFEFQGLQVWNTEIKNSVSHAIVNTANSSIVASKIHDNTGSGYRNSLGRPAFVTFNNVVLYKNDIGLDVPVGGTGGASNQQYNITSSDFSDQVKDGIKFGGTNQITLAIINNIFYDNGTGGTGYGVNLSHSAELGIVNLNNAYGANATGTRNNLLPGTGDVTLTADPFVARSANNFALNSTAGGGAALKAAGYPGVIPNAGTGFADIGALQSQAATGGGNSSYVQ